MGQALYRSYRSRSFDEVVGQDHITKTLKTALKSGRISHAYLFTGPRGVGKTSVARILAHMVNNLEYNGENIHLDIIEIDAASNRRIDEIRDLRDKVHITPTSSKYKVYIVDEVHMLTREAFNALLKTLEEPPAHCIFILATTEAHKLPETIISRTQRFNFKSIATSDAVKHLKHIAAKEKINIDSGALEIIAEHSQGSFRDSISLLDQLSSFATKITAEEVRKQLGLPATEAVEAIDRCLINKEPAALLKILDSLREQAVDSIMLSKLVSKSIRERLASGKFADSDFSLLKNLTEIPASLNPAEALEIALLEAAYPSTKNLMIDTAFENNIPVHPQHEIVTSGNDKNTANVKKPTVEAVEKWDEILDNVKGQAASLYTALRLAKPTVKDSRLFLHFEFALHQKKLKQAANKDILAKTIEKITGKRYDIECLVDEPQNAEVANSKNNTNHKKELTTISNIFGSAEVLES